MADTTISSLNTVNALTANNFIPISDGTNTTKLGTDSLFGFRNRIINGDMRIDQRNNGGLITPSLGSSYPADRWLLQLSSASSLNFQRTNDAPLGFKNSITLTATSASTNNTFLNLVHVIEGNNVYDLKWGTNQASPVTISFWVKASLTGSYSISLYNNPYSSTRAYVTTFIINQSNVWEQKIISVPGDTQGSWNTNENAGIILGFILFNNTSPVYDSWINFTPPNGAWKSGNANFKNTPGATFQLTGVQLETGSSATPYEFRPIGTELALCQRYYQKIGGEGTYEISARGYVAYQNSVFWTSVLPVKLRAIPNASINGNWYVSAANQPVVATATTQNVAVFAERNISGTGDTLFYNAGNYLELNAEF